MGHVTWGLDAALALIDAPDILRALLAKRLAAAGVDVAVVSPKVPSTVTADLGKVSFDAANGVGSIYSPKVTMNAGEVIFDDFAVSTSKGFIGYGPNGASELVGPLKKLLKHTRPQGARQLPLKVIARQRKVQH